MRPALRWSPWRSVAALLLLFTFAQAGGCLIAWRFDRVGLQNGQVWRLLTAHAVHLGWTHWLLNCAGVLLCCALSPALFARPLWLAAQVAVIGLCISLALFFLAPDVASYAGFSGVLYGLFVLGLAPQALRRDAVAAAALLLVPAGWAGSCWPGRLLMKKP